MFGDGGRSATLFNRDVNANFQDDDYNVVHTTHTHTIERLQTLSTLHYSRLYATLVGRLLDLVAGPVRQRM